MKEKKHEEKPEKQIEKASSLLGRLARFQREEIEISKNKKAHGYKYAPLDVIVESIVPYLEKHGIGYVHTLHWDKEEKVHFLTTKIFNEDDTEDYIESQTRIDEEVKLQNQNKFMVLGSAITYFRRYHLVTMLGLTTDEDSDAGGAKQNNQSSVEGALPGKGQVDYISIFTNLISKGKDEKTVRKSFDVHKKKMTEDVSKEVEILIVKSFKKDEGK